jgi:crossover junction endodeoxyribonuclease RuvC
VIALGIDPGTLNLGWGVVARDGNRLRHLDHGVVRLDGKAPLAKRLVHIDEQLRQIVERFSPDVGSVESLFFHKDAQAAAKLGHARGVVLLSLARAGVSVAEYPPARVKLTVAGRGRADKHQVAQMVRAALGLPALPAGDSADALALALTHLRVGPVAERLAESRRAPASGRRPSAEAALRALAAERGRRAVG